MFYSVNKIYVISPIYSVFVLSAKYTIKGIPNEGMNEWMSLLGQSVGGIKITKCRSKKPQSPQNVGSNINGTLFISKG